MSNITTPVDLTAALDEGMTHHRPLRIRLAVGNAQAHEFRITCTRAGQPVDLSGVTATGYVRRPDGATIAVAGTVSGSVASFTLTAPCYAAAGLAAISLELAQNGVRATHMVCTAFVESTRTSTAPAIPDSSLQDAEEVAF